MNKRLLSDDDEIEIILLRRIRVQAEVIALAYKVSRQTVTRLSGHDGNLAGAQLKRTMGVQFSAWHLQMGIEKVIKALRLDA